jgi:glycosyltransferase involved in cell wall biosynthesis
MYYPIWAQHWLPRQCARDRVDLLHTPFHFGLPWSSPCPRVLTLHDAIDRVDYGSCTSWRARWAPRAVANRLDQWAARVRAERVITVSEHARGDLITHLGVPADKITMIPEAADPRFHEPVPLDDRARVRRAHGLVRPYIFYVGGWEGRKNLPFLIRAFAAADLGGVDLVLAGGRDSQRAELLDRARVCGMADRVHRLGWAEEADLPALYAEALVFVNPSAYEGFGLQLCEAMAVGCPTLAARATALPEVLGAGGETFHLDAPDELAGLLRRVATEPDYREELSRRARARSADFSWSRTAEATLEVYHSVMSGQPSAVSHQGSLSLIDGPK